MKKLGVAQIATGGTTIYTVPTGFRTDLNDLMICNTSGTDCTLSLHIVVSGGSYSDSNALFDCTIPANTTIQWSGIQVMNAGDFLKGVAGTATSITIHASGNEYRSGT